MTESKATLATLGPAATNSVTAACTRFAREQGAVGAASAVLLAEETVAAVFFPKVRVALLAACLGLLAVGAGLAYQAYRGSPAQRGQMASVRGFRPAAPRADPLAPLLGVWEDKPGGAILRLGQPGLAHRDSVSCAAFAPDGKTLATGGQDWCVRLWDPSTGREQKVLRHGGWVRSLVWAPDGKLLYSASDGEAVRVWDARTGEELRRRGDRKGSFFSLVLTADGKTLAYCLGQRIVVVQDVKTDKERFRFEAKERAYRLAFSPDGKTLVVGGEKKEIRRWDVPTGKELPALRGHLGATYPVAFSPDGRLIASGGSYLDGEVHLWDAKTGKELRRWLAHAHGVGALAFSPDGKTLLSGHSSVKEPLQSWEVATGKRLRVFAAPAHGLVDSLAFAPDGKRFASAGCWGRGVYLWDLATGAEVSSFARHHDGINAVAFTADGKYLLTASDDHAVGLWKTRGGDLVTRFSGHLGPVRAVAAAPDGKRIATASTGEKVVRLWSCATGKVDRELAGEGSPFACLCFSPDGKILAAGVGGGNLSLPGAREPDRAVFLFDPATGKEIGRLHGKGGRVNALAFSADGRILATAGHDDRFVHLWDPTTGARLAKFEHATASGASQWFFEGTSALAFSPDGRTLATVSFYENKSNLGLASPPREGDVRAVTLWEVATGKSRYEINLPRNTVRSIAVLGGRHLAVGRADGTIRVMDLPGRRWLPTVRGHHDVVAGLAVSPDGRTLASGSLDTTAFLWRKDAMTGAVAVRGPDRAWADDELTRMREGLAGEDATVAYQTMWDMVQKPGSVRLLEKIVRPVPVLTSERIKKLVAALDDDDFKVREKASGQLASLQETAAGTLREALRVHPSAEVRRRAEVLLANLASVRVEATRSRALEALEQMATPRARRHLDVLANGAPEAGVTRQAKEALRRLAGTEGGR